MWIFESVGKVGWFSPAGLSAGDLTDMKYLF